MNDNAVKLAASVLGRKGGLKKNPRKGFGSMSPDRLRELSRNAIYKRWHKK